VSTAPERGNIVGDRPFLDDHARPTFQQLFPGDDASGLLDQEGEDLRRLGSQRDELRAPVERAGRQVDAERPELIVHGRQS
jgi:hypothetical protein